MLSTLKLAHKYCASSIESQARVVATRLTHPSVIKANMKSSGVTLPTIAAIAATVRAPDILRTATEMHLADVQEHGNIPALSLLDFADEFCDAEMKAKFYYLVMIRGPDVWARDDGLTPQRKTTLGIGAASCMNAFTKILRKWDSRYRSEASSLFVQRTFCYCQATDRYRPPPSSCQFNFLDRLIASTAVGSPYDVLGHLEWSMELARPATMYRKRTPEEVDCHELAIWLCRTVLAEEESRLVKYFQFPSYTQV